MPGPSDPGKKRTALAEAVDAIARIFSGYALVAVIGIVMAGAWAIFGPTEDQLMSKYDLHVGDVQVAKKPNDCKFETAPLGQKNCHYEKRVVFAKPRWRNHWWRRGYRKRKARGHETDRQGRRCLRRLGQDSTTKFICILSFRVLCTSSGVRPCRNLACCNPERNSHPFSNGSCRKGLVLPATAKHLEI